MSPRRLQNACTKSSEKKRSEGEDRIRSDGSGGPRLAVTEPQHSKEFRKPTRSDEEPESYASPTDALKALYTKRTGELISQKLLDDLRGSLGGEITQAFIDEINTHNGNFTNFPGFLKKLSRERSRSASAPVTAAEAYKCIKCGSTKKGEGLRLGDDGKVTFCECASVEYIAAKGTEVETMNAVSNEAKEQARMTVADPERETRVAAASNGGGERA